MILICEPGAFYLFGSSMLTFDDLEQLQQAFAVDENSRHDLGSGNFCTPDARVTQYVSRDACSKCPIRRYQECANRNAIYEQSPIVGALAKFFDLRGALRDFCGVLLSPVKQLFSPMYVIELNGYPH